MNIFKEFLDFLLGDDLAGIERRNEIFIWKDMVNTLKSEQLFCLEGYRFFLDFYLKNLTCNDESLVSVSENGILAIKNCSKNPATYQDLVLKINGQKQINTERIRELYNLSIYEGVYFKNIFSNNNYPDNFKTLLLCKNLINSKWEVLCVF